MRNLTAHDRCDQCGAQAKTIASRRRHADSGPQELLFCGHHTHQHLLALRAQGWLVETTREMEPALA